VGRILRRDSIEEPWEGEKGKRDEEIVGWEENDSVRERRGWIGFLEKRYEIFDRSSAIISTLVTELLKGNAAISHGDTNSK
jgi:hypothetical protein